MITMEASFRALDAFISPSAAITYGQGKGEVRLEQATWRHSAIMKLDTNSFSSQVHFQCFDFKEKTVTNRKLIYY